MFGQLYLPGALYSLSAPAGDLLGRMLRDMLSQGEERQPQRRVGHSLLALFCKLSDNPTKFHAALLQGDVNTLVAAAQSLHSDVFCNASKVVLCGRCNTFATFSQDELQFSWQAQHFGRVQRHFAWQAQHFRRVVLDVFANCIVRAASSGDKVKFRGRRGIL